MLKMQQNNGRNNYPISTVELDCICWVEFVDSGGNGMPVGAGQVTNLQEPRD